ncbi:hypothetical protein E2C01_095196 [Portunus trituberculatus]|uniref:Uncharacterized protein n=1 Tax=Portunus trituberculatus TaxID=210409 RepID=A0A5B7JSG8_PORTR|nr:hypothetical protein [Portunus trituberculatus]
MSRVVPPSGLLVFRDHHTRPGARWGTRGSVALWLCGSVAQFKAHRGTGPQRHKGTGI